MALSSEPHSFSHSKDTKRKIAELEMQVAFLSNDLSNEREEKRRLQKELKEAKDEISRLHEQNGIAASQLRKFTEWLFASMDQHQQK